MLELTRAYNRSLVPLYLQVASVMRQRIERREWLPRQKIPTLVELEEEFQVARVTVRQAVNILQEEGLLDSQQGRGTFVVEKPIIRHWVKLATSWNVLVESIQDNIPRPIKVANPPLRPNLRADEGKLSSKYIFQRSLQFKEDEPYGVVNVHLAQEIYRQSPAAFRQHPALSVLTDLKGADIQHAHQTVVIGSADPTTAELLGIGLGAPTAECRCVVVNGKGVAIYVADIIYRSDAIQLHIDLLPKPAAHSKRSKGRR